MIYSAIESSARVIMVLDENGKYIAGSLVTHQIGKDGKSHVCFDSIEVNANRARIRTDEYQVTLKRIENLKREGVLKTGSLEEIHQYCRDNPQTKKRRLTQSRGYRFLENTSYLFSGIGIRTFKKFIDSKDMRITEEDLHSIEINNKILDVYRIATEEMCQRDEEVRTKQLEKGEISRDVYNHILMRNGLFTIGRNPVSMYLGNLDKLSKESMEKLPMPQKSRSIYWKAHYGHGSPNLIKKISMISIDGMLTTSVALSIASIALSCFTPELVALTGLCAVGSFISHKVLRQKKIRGVITDSLKEQRVLRDGREKDITGEILSKDNIKEFQDKLTYNEAPVISNPTLFSKLSSEENKKLRRLVESVSNGEKINLQDESLIIGNLENWAAKFSINEGKLKLENVFLTSPLSYGNNAKKYTDAQNDLLDSILRISESNELEFSCKDEKTNEYLLRCAAKRTNKTEQIKGNPAYEIGL